MNPLDLIDGDEVLVNNLTLVNARGIIVEHIRDTEFFAVFILGGRPRTLKCHVDELKKVVKNDD